MPDNIFTSIPEQKETLVWCDRCGDWHYAGSLTLCKLHDARDRMFGIKHDESTQLPPKPRPWKREPSNGG